MLVYVRDSPGEVQSRTAIQLQLILDHGIDCVGRSSVHGDVVFWYVLLAGVGRAVRGEVRTLMARLARMVAIVIQVADDALGVDLVDGG